MTTELTIDLMPCPFCGKKNIEYVDATKILGVHRIIHRCDMVGFINIEKMDKQRAINAWNNRSEYSVIPPTQDNSK